ncbi:MAG: hypothetical protein NT011_06565 [Kiritimatiellaeota bacterium]|nr:hypothetical protein [Kiritimatiellota bacterium]
MRRSLPWCMMGRMAHERYPPPGYVEDFTPNVKLVKKVIVVTPRLIRVQGGGANRS